MIGGGVLLLLFKQIGWNGLLPCVALSSSPPSATLFQQRHPHPAEGSARTGQKGRCDLFLRPPEHLETDRFPLSYYSGLTRTPRHAETLAVDLGYDMKEIGVMSGVAGIFRRVPLLVCRRDDRTADRPFPRAHPVRGVCLDSDTLLPRTLLRASDDAHALRRDFPSVGQLRDGDDRGLYDGNGLCTPWARRDGFHDPDGHHASQRHVDGILSGRIADHTGYHGLFFFEASIA